MLVDLFKSTSVQNLCLNGLCRSRNLRNFLQPHGLDALFLFTVFFLFLIAWWSMLCRYFDIYSVRWPESFGNFGSSSGLLILRRPRISSGGVYCTQWILHRFDPFLGDMPSTYNFTNLDSRLPSQSESSIRSGGNRHKEIGFCLSAQFTSTNPVSKCIKCSLQAIFHTKI